MATGGLLYAIRAEGTSLVKIGYTRGSVEKRIKTLQTGQPFRLRLISTVSVEQDARRTEALLHAFLKQERRQGEWFEISLDEQGLAELLTRAIAFGREQEALKAAQAARRQALKEARQHSAAHRMAAPPKKKRPRLVNLTQLGERVRKARDALGMKQLQLAELLGSPQGWLSELESGKHASMEVDTVRRLAETFGISTDYLLGLTDDPAPPSGRTNRIRKKDHGQQ